MKNQSATYLRSKNAPMLLAGRGRENPDGIAFREKRLGLYQECAWRQYAEQVGRFALALRELGLKPGDRLAIMGDAFADYAVCDLAAQAVGAIVYGIYPTASAEEVAFQLKDGGASIFIAENQEYVDKVLAVIDEAPDLNWIIVDDNSAMFGIDDPKIKSCKEIVSAIDTNGEEALVALETFAQAIDPSDVAFIIYTSGTTGNPKGVMISHGNHLAAAYTFIDLFPVLLEQDLRTVVYLPLCHILGRDLAITLPLISGVVPHYGESVDVLAQTFFEVAPNMVFIVPRYLQKFASQIFIDINDASWLKRFLYNVALAIGREHARLRWDGTIGLFQKIKYYLARAVVFRPMLNKLGFDQLKLVISGGAALPTETAALWQIYGVNVLEVYGQTETTGAMICGQASPFPRPGDVGFPPSGWEVKLGENDEVIARSEDLFLGYWKNKAATDEVLDKDGWLHTGDVGEWNNGNLRLVDRLRDFIVTDGGKSISPGYIENIARASPYVAEVMIVGDGRKFLTALIEVEYDTASQWARTNDIAYSGYTSLTEHESLHELMRSEISKMNKQLARVEQVKDFRILPKMLDPEEEGEPVTPTRKVKRKLMHDRFITLIESMYDDVESRRVLQGIGDVLSDKTEGKSGIS